MSDTGMAVPQAPVGALVIRFTYDTVEIERRRRTALGNGRRDPSADTSTSIGVAALRAAA